MSRYLRGAVAILIVLMGMLGSVSLSAAAPDTRSDAALSAAVGDTGTVVVSDSICAGQEGVIWGGTPGANCEAGSAGFVFYLFGDGTDDNWSLNVSGSNSIVLPAGTYEVYENIYWTASTFELAAGGEVHLTVLHPGAALPEPPPPPPPPPPPAATGTVVVSDFLCAGQTGVIWYGTAGANCVAGAADFVFYLIGDGSDEYWSLSVNGTNSRTLPAGTYEVYEGTHWTMANVTVTAGGTAYVNVLHPGGKLPPPPPPPAPADGTVVVSKSVCDGLDKVVWGQAPDENCSAGKATFYFYLIGDGTDEYWTLHVDGSASMKLAPGTYEVYEDGHWSMGKVTITSGATTNLSVLNPGKPLPPPPVEKGTVNVTKSVCDGLDTVKWGVAPDGNCSAGKATFYFYLIGDGSDAYSTLAVDGSASINLAPGTYEVWEDGHWSMGKVTVKSGETTNLSVLNPGKPLPPPAPKTGMVHATKLVCDGQEGVLWEDDDNANCEPADATLYFYLVGDGTDDYWKLNVVDGSGSIELAVGTYEVWESGSWSKGSVTVTDGATSIVHIQNPGDPLPPPPPPTGKVTINKYVCDDIKSVVWGGTADGKCAAGEASFYFYLVGDGTDDFWKLDVDGSGTITLQTGTYEVWENGNWSKYEVDVTDGDTVVLNVLNPGD